MKRLNCVLYALVVGLLFMWGCGEAGPTESEVLTDKLYAAGADPAMLLYTFLSTVAAFSAALYWLAGRGVREAIIDGLRFGGLLMACISPMFYLIAENKEYAYALGIAGLSAAILTTVLFYNETYHARRRMRTRKRNHELEDREAMPDDVDEEDVDIDLEAADI